MKAGAVMRRSIVVATSVERCPWELRLVPGATHLFEEPGALETVARLASDWFLEHLGGRECR